MRKGSVALAVACLMVMLPAMGQAPPVSAPGVAINGPAGVYTSTITLAQPGPVNISTPWTGPAGVYSITLPASSTITQTDSGITITWGTPTPAPTPPPAPTNTTGPYTVLYLWDTASANPVSAGQVALQTSTTIGPSLKALAFGNQWIAGDIASVLTLKNWASFARTAGTPCVIICMVDESNVSRTVETMTGTNFPGFDESTVKAEIRRLASGGVPK